MPFGLLSTGFAAKPLATIKEEIEAAYKAAFGASIGSNPDGSIPAQTAFGQIIGAHVGPLAELWELAQAVYSAQDPDAAGDAALDNLCAITGTIREGEEHSTVELSLCGTPATTVPAGSRASVPTVNTVFALDADATIVLEAAWANGVAVALGVRRRSSFPRIYECVQAGITAAEPTGTGTGIVDGTAKWDYVGEGTGSIDAAATATEPGALAALARACVTIDTPVAGWSSVLNLDDAVVGRAEESDPDLRIRRENELVGEALAGKEKIKAHVLDVEDVTEVVVFENYTLIVDPVTGLPPKSVEVIALGGTNAAVRQGVFEAVAGGIETYGGVSGTVVDSSGNSHTVKFSRPTEIPIWIVINLKYIAGTYPATGDADVKAAVLARGEQLLIGHDVRSSPFKAAAFSVAGVLDVTAAYIGIAPGPVAEADIVIGLRELATFTGAHVTVNSVAAVP